MQDKYPQITQINADFVFACGFRKSLVVVRWALDHEATKAEKYG
jgi:hypothetical protein